MELCDILHEVETASPDALFIINGDFNFCSLRKSNVHFYQHVTCTTRGTATLDLLYSNVKDAYRSIQLPPLGKADHNLVYLIPKYRPIVQREKPKIMTVQQWNEDSIEHLRAELDATDWNVFVEAAGDLDELTETVSEYINFCVDLTIPTKKTKVFPNNKPWITKRVKSIINKKKGIFSKGDLEGLKQVQSELKRVIREEKAVYKDKVEGFFTGNNMKRVWEGMRLMSGYSNKSKSCLLPNESISYANELNKFYNRFDHHNFLDQRNNLTDLLSDSDYDFMTTESEVRRYFTQLHSSKAAGPDKLSPRVLKHCAIQLANIFMFIFNKSFTTRSVPSLWKQSCIIPVPKTSAISCLNDLRPVALTAVPMKVCERIFLEHFKPFVTPFLDSLQFAYQSSRSCEDAVLVILEKLYSYLEYPNRGNHARVMFFDFSSAFNTIQPHVLVRKLVSMKVPNSLTHWIMNYLTNRSQFVKLSPSCLSDVITSNTGAPQGTVLAPFLFTLYTFDARSSEEGCSLIKFADDTAMVGLINDDNDNAYLSQIQSFVNYCDSNFLELNVSKTKEMLIDYRRNISPPPPVFIKGTAVERVDKYKYLGVVLNNKLTWDDHVDVLVKKLNSRLYCLRKLSNFNVSSEILGIFYNCTFSGVWRYCLICWGGNVSKTELSRIESIIKKAEKVIGESQLSVESIYQCLLQSKLDAVWDDPSHPLYDVFHENRIERGIGRLRLPCFKTNRHRNSFVPRAMMLFNDNLLR